MGILKISSARCNEERRGTSCRLHVRRELKSGFVLSVICLKVILNELARNVGSGQMDPEKNCPPEYSSYTQI